MLRLKFGVRSKIHSEFSLWPLRLRILPNPVDPGKNPIMKAMDRRASWPSVICPDRNRKPLRYRAKSIRRRLVVLIAAPWTQGARAGLRRNHRGNQGWCHIIHPRSVSMYSGRHLHGKVPMQRMFGYQKTEHLRYSFMSLNGWLVDLSALLWYRSATGGWGSREIVFQAFTMILFTHDIKSVRVR